MTQNTHVDIACIFMMLCIVAKRYILQQKLPEEVNRKWPNAGVTHRLLSLNIVEQQMLSDKKSDVCHPHKRNTSVQFSTPFTDPEPSNSPPHNFCI